MAFTTMVGARIRRREDPRLITGRATYVDDVRQVNTCYAAFVRSPHGHAKITSIDVTAAKADTHHAHNLKSSLPVAHKMGALGLKTPPHYILALDEVRFVGEAVAVVIAD